MNLTSNRFTAVFTLLLVFCSSGMSLRAHAGEVSLNEQLAECRLAAGFNEREEIIAAVKPDAIALCQRLTTQSGAPAAAWAFLGRALYMNKQSDAARKVIEVAAERGSVVGWLLMGVTYQYGDGVSENHEQAAIWFHKAAARENATAQGKLGVMYRDGSGVPQSDTEAVAWLRKAAEQGNADAQLNLGYMYDSGRGVPQSDTEAVAWYRKAAEQGSADAQTDLGFMYDSGRGVPQSDTEAVAWYRKAAEQGNVNAQNNLGVMYRDGRGVTQSDTEAVAWFRKAAEQGDSRGQRNIAAQYYIGGGVQQSDQQALFWMEKAAEHGDSGIAKLVCQLNMISGDLVISQKRDKARIWCERAWKEGKEGDDGALLDWLDLFSPPAAMAYLDHESTWAWQTRNEMRIRYLLQRDIVWPTLKEALAFVQTPEFLALADAEQQSIKRRLLNELNLDDVQLAKLGAHYRWLGVWQQLSKAGVGKASEMLGLIHKNGLGVAANPRLARQYYLLAFQQQRASAATAMGQMYTDGLGGARDLKVAMHWYMQAAQQGDADGMVQAGLNFLHGVGTAVNYEQAQHWLVRADQLYMSDAHQEVKRRSTLLGLAVLYGHGYGVPQDLQDAATYYREAANRGSPYAAWAYAAMLRRGQVPEIAADDAVLWEQYGAELLDKETLVSLLEKKNRALSAAELEVVVPGISTFCRIRPEQARHWLPPKWQRRVACLQKAQGLIADAAPLLEAERLQQIARQELAHREYVRAANSYDAAANWLRANGKGDDAQVVKIHALHAWELYAGEWQGAGTYLGMLIRSCHAGTAAAWARDSKMPALALTLAKYSVNLLQDAREQLDGLDATVRECFVKVQEGRYRMLADLFVSMQRYGEAEQVMNMLKDFETNEYLKRRSDHRHAKLALTEAEQKIVNQITAGTQALVGAEMAQEGGESASIVRPINKETVLRQLRALKQDRARDVEYAGAIRPTLRKPAFKGSALLQMVVMPDSLVMLLTTAEKQYGYRVAVDRGALYGKVNVLTKAIATRTSAGVAAQSLYSILMPADLEAQLKASGVQTLMLAADDFLRYIPFATLYDGKRYLVEKFALVTYNPAIPQVLEQAMPADWRVAAFGASKGFPEPFDGLPYVENELDLIVRSRTQPKKGVIPGDPPALNERFTIQRLIQAMNDGKAPLIHVATHFQLAPSKVDQSRLFLGMGKSLTVPELEQMLDEVSVQGAGPKMITLSACQTGMPAAGNQPTGSEIDSLSRLMEARGIPTVVASLWNVNDRNTARLMKRFYELMISNKGMNKAKALQQLQKEEIAHGDLRSHPYYWAPFVMMGNWI